MTTLQQLNETLGRYVRPQSFPVAARMCSSLEELPERVQFPKRDLGFLMPICQAVGMTRRYGVTMAVGLEDMNCPLGVFALGFVPAKKRYLAGEFAMSPIPKESFARFLQGLPRLEYGKYKYVLLAPIHRANFEPHLVIIYGFPAQVALLAQAAVFMTGKSLHTTPSLGAVCSPLFAATMLSNECQVVIPCAGDRVFGSTQDHEIAFTAPQGKLEEIMQSLERCYKTGVYRYPTLTNLRFESEFPESYQKAMEYLTQEGE